jgi:hypothetical protein
MQHHRRPDNAAVTAIAAVPYGSPEVLAMPGAVMQGLRGQRDDGKKQQNDQVRPRKAIHEDTLPQLGSTEAKKF